MARISALQPLHARGVLIGIHCPLSHMLCMCCRAAGLAICEANLPRGGERRKRRSDWRTRPRQKPCRHSSRRAGDRASSRQGALLLHHRIGQQEKALEKTGKPIGALLNLPTHRCHILETGNDSYHFKASSDAATKTAKEKPALTKT